MRPDQRIIDEKYGLTQKQLDFCIAYVETGNGRQSAIKAGYTEKSAAYQGSMLLTKQNIKNKIYDLRHDETKLRIASGMEVMDFFTRVMNGEVKDQFGLEASLSDRLKAANELAKRTTDVDLKADGKVDNEIKIKLEWGGEDAGTEETNKTSKEK
jgi:phage terminase small subunit